ncbi:MULTISPECIES: aminopeptidase P N-terminal domain-containing protein [Candidatus Ichthyocystis]|uniref:aminopeptidase P N-terminal domain-containing protein n=1 Tax=Candidatus Ichthyocystis TaxID=2929841 RepID=UPI000AA71D24|nr:MULTISPECIES: aminopeptidase P N-terminal domain-containing protein [Ichthyocystis]
MIDNSICLKRLGNLACELENGLVIISNSPEKYRNFHIAYPYRHDSNFYYLTGFSEPSSAICIKIHQGNIAETTLFCLPKNPDEEIWTGERLGIEGAKDKFNFDKFFRYDVLIDELSSMLPDFTHIYANFGQNPKVDQLLYDYQKEKHFSSSYDSSIILEDIQYHIGKLRLIKDNYEIQTIQRAIDITEKAHCQAARSIAPGRWEYEIEAELMHVFYKEGSRRTAYDSIVASGDRACTLHYTNNDKLIQLKDLVLIDAGCEYEGYASDITRTYPASGKYEGLSKEIYELVILAQEEAIRAICPGRDLVEVHLAAINTLSQGLIDMGVFKQPLDDVLSKKLYKKYSIHSTSHTLGADVHDTGFHDVGHKPNILQSGVIITVEPGLYFRKSDDISDSFWGIGVRIEDDVLVTDNGCIVMSSRIPKSCEDVEVMMRS